MKRGMAFSVLPYSAAWAALRRGALVGEVARRRIAAGEWLGTRIAAGT